MNICTDVEWEARENGSSGTSYEIVELGGGSVLAETYGIDEEEARNIAHLIAAAPDLYEVADLALCDLIQPGSVNREMLEAKARAALARARGEA